MALEDLFVAREDLFAAREDLFAAREDLLAARKVLLTPLDRLWSWGEIRYCSLVALYLTAEVFRE